MTGRDRRALVLGSGIFLTALLLVRGGPAAVRFIRDAHAALATQARELAALREQVEAGPALLEEGTRVRDSLGQLAPRILAGRSRAEAVDDLTERLSLAAARHRVRLDAAVPAGDSARAGALQRVTVEARLTGDLRGMVETLETLAEDRVPLRIAQYRVIGADPATPPDQPEVLQAELTVRGWFLSDATEHP